MEAFLIPLLIIILVLLIILFFKKPATQENSAALLELKEQENLKAINWLKEEKQKLEDELNDLRSIFMTERSKVIKAEENLLAQQQKQSEQEKYIAELQLRFKLEFENIANKVLEEKTEKFTLQNKANLDIILNPLKENIKAFEDKVDKVYKAESDERNILKGVISQLMDQSKQIQEDANNLTRALKGDNKKQGNWGEVILERVLERSGLVKDREYRIQTSLSSSEGSRMQPDVIIDLPDDKHIVIDSKVSLIAYERLVTADTDEDRETELKQHLNSIKAHIQGLSSKNYHELYQINSPDFVLLFIPIESSFGIAVQKDAELFNYAWDRKVVIVSPSTLLATLRTIASIWKQERQNRNVLEIARLSGSMYDKFVGFLADMEGIGRNIKLSQDAYDKALNKLSTGSGNLSNTSEKIKKLGAKATKQIDTKFLDPILSSDEEL
ncbi:DNA recombination protein RmuC [Pedobacter hiemivivus]|uniref:DNA recombination protein RmuC n=1 Tax=Pedobacter hiemivivus TaxID=2530454 RepID=A0A4U1G5G3_9SPHI|nr:DNA recombination protein RmuC [Pedobacter hiemivivus]TCC95088.1 DNA recombination protein RmuC [Pedobacter hiemivivus]TKC58079.1 DNA recombination protein RmuC [Pedobacter hiemivivus]